MRRYEFIHTDAFDRSVKAVIADEQLREIQDALCQDPEQGAVIRGTGGMRKMRWALPGRGKSGGVRVIYLYLAEQERIHLILVYPKNKKETLTDAVKSALRLRAAILKAEK